MAWADEPFDDPLDEREYPQPEDLDVDEEELALASIAPCPSCGKMVHEDAEQCPHCRQWIVWRGDDLRAPSKAYMRFGLWFARTFLLNWVFWLVLTVLGVVGFWLARRGA